MSFWGRCESLSDLNGVWFSGSNQQNAALSVDQSRKSSLGTGSLHATLPDANLNWDCYIGNWHNAAGNLTKDYQTIRPKSIYLYSQASTYQQVTIQVITRENDGWNIHTVADTTLIPNQETIIDLNYSNIPLASLPYSIGFNIIVRVNQGALDLYIMTVTREIVTQPPEPPPEPPPEEPPLTNDQWMIILAVVSIFVAIIALKRRR